MRDTHPRSGRLTKRRQPPVQAYLWDTDSHVTFASNGQADVNGQKWSERENVDGDERKPSCGEEKHNERGKTKGKTRVRRISSSSAAGSRGSTDRGSGGTADGRATPGYKKKVGGAGSTNKHGDGSSIEYAASSAAHRAEKPNCSDRTVKPHHKSQCNTDGASDVAADRVNPTLTNSSQSVSSACADNHIPPYLNSDHQDYYNYQEAVLDQYKCDSQQKRKYFRFGEKQRPQSERPYSHVSAKDSSKLETVGKLSKVKEENTDHHLAFVNLELDLDTERDSVGGLRSPGLDLSRPQSYLGFSRNDTINNHVGNKDLTTSTEHKKVETTTSGYSDHKKSYPYSARSYQNSGYFTSRSDKKQKFTRPQTARTGGYTSATNRAITPGRSYEGSKKGSAHSRGQSSTDLSLKKHLERQEQHRHRAPNCLTSYDTSVTSHLLSEEQTSPHPTRTQTPNLYRKLSLAGEDSSVTLTLGQKEGQLDGSGGIGGRPENFYPRRSQSSLSFSRGASGFNPPRCDSSLGINTNHIAPGTAESSNTHSTTTYNTKKKVVFNGGDNCNTITTREPSSARLSVVGSRRASDTTKLLQLVGKQPGFLSTLALVENTISDDQATLEKRSPSTETGDDTVATIPKDNYKTVSRKDTKEAESTSGTTYLSEHVTTKETGTKRPTKANGDHSTLTSSSTRRYSVVDTVDAHTLETFVSEDLIRSTLESPNVSYDVATAAVDRSPLAHTVDSNIVPKVTEKSRSTAGNVTFDLPDDEVYSDDEEDESYEHQEQTVCWSTYRRMSAPELPPIDGKGGNLPGGKTPRGDKRKTSNHSVHSTGSKSSLHQMSAAVNSKTYFNRKSSNSSVNNNNNSSSNNTTTTSGSKRVKKKRMPIPRNHSDSSLKNMVAKQQNGSNYTGSSGSAFSSSNLPAGDGRDSGTTSGTTSGRPPKYLSGGSRAQSWCATENSGSQLKLETLFEGHNINGGGDNNVTTLPDLDGVYTNSSIYGSGRPLASPLANPMNHSNSNTSINNIYRDAGGGSGASRTGTPPASAAAINNFRNFNNASALGMVGGSSRKTGNAVGSDNMPPLLPPRSVSVNGIRSREDIARLAAMNRFGNTSAEEGTEVFVDSVEDVLARGYLRRSQSENRLAATPNKNSRGLTQENSGSGNYLNQVDDVDIRGGEGRRQSNNTRPGAAQGRSLSRNLSVDRLDRLTSKNNGPRHKQSYLQNGGGTGSRVGSYGNLNNVINNNNNSTKGTKGSSNPGHGRMRRVSSLSAMGNGSTTNSPTKQKFGANNSYSKSQFNNNNNTINNNNNNNNSDRPSRTLKRYNSRERCSNVLADIGNQEDDIRAAEDDDEESIEASARLVEWLNVVNNVEEYDTDPQHTIVEYSDEPPQTDTAVHVVYEG